MGWVGLNGRNLKIITALRSEDPTRIGSPEAGTVGSGIKETRKVIGFPTGLQSDHQEEREKTMKEMCNLGARRVKETSARAAQHKSCKSEVFKTKRHVFYVVYEKSSRKTRGISTYPITSRSATCCSYRVVLVQPLEKVVDVMKIARLPGVQYPREEEKRLCQCRWGILACQRCRISKKRERNVANAKR